MEPIQQLEAVLCDPEYRVCIDGSDGDRMVVQEALQSLREQILALTAEKIELNGDYNRAVARLTDANLKIEGLEYDIATITKERDEWQNKAGAFEESMLMFEKDFEACRKWIFDFAALVAAETREECAKLCEARTIKGREVFAAAIRRMK